MTGSLMCLVAQNDDTKKFTNRLQSNERGVTASETKLTALKANERLYISRYADMIHSFYLRIELPDKCHWELVLEMLGDIVLEYYGRTADQLSGKFIENWLTLYHPEWFQEYGYTDEFMIPLPLLSGDFTQSQWGIDFNVVLYGMTEIFLTIHTKSTSLGLMLGERNKWFPPLVCQTIREYDIENDMKMSIATRYVFYDNQYRRAVCQNIYQAIVCHDPVVEFELAGNECLCVLNESNMFEGIPHSLLFEVDVPGFKFADLECIDILLNCHNMGRMCPTTVRMDYFAEGIQVPKKGLYMRKFGETEVFSWDEIDTISIRFKSKKSVVGTLKIWHMRNKCGVLRML